MIHLVTGYAGYGHIQSEDDGAFNAAFFGNGQYVMESGNMFGGSIIDNNTVRILDGDLLMYGRHTRIMPDTYEDVTITTGAAGVNRIDLICMTYSKNENDGTEAAYLEVIQGAESTGTASIPEYTDGNILEGAILNQMPLYKVSIEGVALKSIAPMFATIPTYKALAEKYAAEFEKKCEAYLGSLDVLDTMEEIEANTQKKQLAGALAVKEGFEQVNTDLNAVKSDLSKNTYCYGRCIGTGLSFEISGSPRYLGNGASYETETIGDACTAQSNGVLINEAGYYDIYLAVLLYGATDNTISLGMRKYISADDYDDNTLKFIGGDGIHLQYTRMSVELEAGVLLRPIASGASAAGTISTVNFKVVKCSIPGTIGDTITGLPTVTTDDNGKHLEVINGEWAVAKQNCTIVKTDVAAEQEFAFALVSSYGKYMYQTDGYAAIAQLVDGETYTVVWDATEYTCTAESMEFGSFSGIGLGNKAILDFGDDTNEPFLFVYLSDYDSNIFVSNDTETTHTINIYQEEEVISSLPLVTAADNGKHLEVVNGKWVTVAFEDSALKTDIADYVDSYIEEALGGEY